MGAKQSKRSVDISGKEAEGAGEVAVAGAGGEGRVEALADADALKPQLNGAAHIHDQTDKEKQLDSGTPENEKEATTEKEAKEQEDESEKEAAPVTNGESEPKAENGESSPAPEDGKKPKKEKVKKKWSLRSISFSRKDKPKQEKKQKEEEPKTNGEPEKVPEEAAEATPESAANEVAEEAKPEAEAKDQKTPETPVTEPLTNGSSTPETPIAETPAAEVAAPAAASPDTDRPEPKPEIQPEQLPVNGLSIEEPKAEAPLVHSEEIKPQEPIAELKETVPAPEIPVKIEVCVEQMPVEPTPPPLPANPPPSSVASFAATTMAPELTDASLANTAELATSAPPAVPDTKPEILGQTAPEPELQIILTNIGNVNHNEIVSIQLPPPLKEIIEEKSVEIEIQPKIEKLPLVEIENLPEPEIVKLPEPEIEKLLQAKIENVSELNIETLAEPEIRKLPKPETQNIDVLVPTVAEINVPTPESNVDTYETIKETKPEQITFTDSMTPNQDQFIPKDETTMEIKAALVSYSEKVQELPEPVDIEDLPLPLPLDDDLPADKDIVEKNINDSVQEKIEIAHETKETVVNSNHISEMNGVNTASHNGNNTTEHENLKNKTKDLLGNLIETVECNGNIEEKVPKQEVEATLQASDSVETPDDSTLPSLSEANESLGAADGSEAFPPPPPASELCRDERRASPEPPPQEVLPVSDKLADLIPEVPVVPELKTETLQETTSDVALAN